MAFFNRMMGKMPFGGGTSAFVGFCGGAAYVVANYSMVSVDGGHSAVVFNRLSGLRETPLKTGTHFIIPFLERATDFDIRHQSRNYRSQTASRDLQQVNVELRILFEPDASSLPRIYQELGEDYHERVLPSICNEVCKAVIARYKAEELIQKRQMLSSEIHQALLDRGARFHINVEEATIPHLSFGKQYSDAIEKKQVAQQDAEKARFKVDQAQQEKKSTIIKAKGEAEAAELLGKSMKDNPGFLKLRRIDAAREIAATIAESSNRVYLNADSLLMNLGDVDVKK